MKWPWSKKPTTTSSGSPKTYKFSGGVKRPQIRIGITEGPDQPAVLDSILRGDVQEIPQTWPEGKFGPDPLPQVFDGILSGRIGLPSAARTRFPRKHERFVEPQVSAEKAEREVQSPIARRLAGGKPAIEPTNPMDLRRELESLRDEEFVEGTRPGVRDGKKYGY